MADTDPPKSLIPSENRMVVFELPFPLALPDRSGPGEIYVAGQPPAAIALARQMNERATIQTTGILIGGDPYGRASFTMIQVRFNGSVSPEVLAWSEDELISAAMHATNRLIAHYRDVFDSPLVRQVRIEHIVHFRVIDHDGETEPTVRFISRASGPIHIGSSAEDQEREHELRERLQVESEPYFLRNLELDVQAHFVIGDNRLAVIEAASLFESWLKASLRNIYESHGLGDEEITHKLIAFDNRGRPRLTKHGQYRFLDVSALIDNVMPDATGYQEFPTTAEYQNWVKAKDLRNDIIHGTSGHINVEEAHTAVSAFFAAIHHLREHAEMP